MFGGFNALGLVDKRGMLCMYIVAVVVVVLWALFIEERKKNKSLSRRIALLTRQDGENTESATSRHYDNQKVEKHSEKTVVWKHLLGIIINVFKKNTFYYSPDNKGNNQRHKGNKFHSRSIIGRATKGVNRNRAEPQKPSRTYFPTLPPYRGCPS
jgi:hypothetical protein